MGPDLLLPWLADQLIRIGPVLLFVICLLETAVFVGLVLPVGALIGFGALLAARGVMDPAEVALAAMTGALIGDQIGFALGRWFVPVRRPPAGAITRLWQGGVQRAESLVRRQGLLGVSAARTIPFVRTIMPWFAGRAGMRWGRFLVFDLLGVLAWATVYVGGGFAAGYGWEAVAERFGEGEGAVIMILVGVALAVAVHLWARRLIRRRHGRIRRGGRSS